MPPVEFEPTITAGERPQTYALDRAATGTGRLGVSYPEFTQFMKEVGLPCSDLFKAFKCSYQHYARITNTTFI